MQGQWIGTYNGSNSGLIIIDVDNAGDHFEGAAYLFDDNPDLPGSLCLFRTADKAPEFQLKLAVDALHPISGDHIPRALVPSTLPNIVFPSEADVTIRWDEATLRVEWRTNIETHGAAELPASKSGQPSEYAPEAGVLDWESFKQFVNRANPGRFIYRGQCVSNRLRTAFHRTQRTDLIRFINNDIPILHRYLSARTKHVFDLLRPLENGAFFNLVQHHGYPTPLLDWSLSPFVAAYFGFRNPDPTGVLGENVRIFIFDQRAWLSDFNQLQKLAFSKPHFSILQALAIENERAVPQQALSTISNVDDIESYIRSKESEERRYLFVVDLPRAERAKVLHELSIMGITSGSMFPGLDGTCEEVRSRLFGF